MATPIPKTTANYLDNAYMFFKKQKFEDNKNLADAIIISYSKRYAKGSNNVYFPKNMTVL
jgi:hypothetical protein